jgi:hypothetical protein
MYAPTCYCVQVAALGQSMGCLHRYSYLLMLYILAEPVGSGAAT